MSAQIPEADEDEEPRSRYTFRDLKNLKRSSTSCPLRVIALIDFDAFYAQCETVRLGLPQDQPLAVVQFNNCIALNYAAKAAGLKRIASPEDAKRKCPEIVLQHVATWREGDTKWAYRSDAKEHMKTDKAALDPYRLQSRTAFNFIKHQLFPPPIQKVEKASIDEVFLDLSAQVHELLLLRYPDLALESENGDIDSLLPFPSTSVLDWDTDVIITADAFAEAAAPDWDDIVLNIGAEIVRNVRQAVLDHRHFTCSAGIARNKVVAKLAAGHSKPNKQTVIRNRAVGAFLAEYKFTKIRGLGGKLGSKVVQEFGTDATSELLKVSQAAMRAKLGPESATWVFNTIRGNEFSEVVERTQLQSMLAAKTFIPKATGVEQAEKWLRIFAEDLIGRLEEQDATSKHRRPKTITMHHSIDGRFGPTRSKQMPIPLGAEINAPLLLRLSKNLLEQLSREGPTWPCLVISVSVSDFEDGIEKNRNVTSFFAPRTCSGSIDGTSGKQSPSEIFSADISPLEGGGKRKRSDDQGNGHAAKALDRYVRLRQDSSTISETSTADKVDRAKNPLRQEKVTQDEQNSYHCPKCGNYIVAEEVLEHLDWHVAIELQAE